jgi:hypothetical protein
MAYGIPGVSPNLIAQQQRITGLPSDPQETALAKYLVQLTQQNKVGTPEYFLAAGEFQNRQKIRQEQAAKQTQGPKVVENITAQAVQKAVPQMAMVAPVDRGVGALDAGGMGRIESPTYTGAMGGIVAFEDGGEAKVDLTPEVEKLYTENLGRGSDVEGLRYWVDKFSKDNKLTADERAEFINAAAPEVQRRLAAGDTNLPSYMRVNPEVRYALQSKDITTDQYKKLANYFGNQWIGGEAEDPESLTRRDYIERPRSGYDLATFLSTRSEAHGAAPDTKERMADLLAPYMGASVGQTRTAGDETTARYIMNPMTGETEIASPLGVDNLYRMYRQPHQGTIGDPEKGSRYAVGMDYYVDPETGEARMVSPYTEYYKDRGHRDWQGPLGIASLAAGAYFFPGMSIGDMIARNAISLGTKAVTKAEGGEVKRYQGAQGSVVSSPFSRDIRSFGETGLSSMLRRTPGMVGAYAQPLISEEEDERMRLMQMLNQRYGGRGSLIQGYFMDQSPAEREQAKEIVSRLPTMSLAELRTLAGTGPQATPVVRTAAADTEPFRQGTQADVRKADIAAGGADSPSMPATTPAYIPRAMQIGDVTKAPAAATPFSALLAQAEEAVRPKGSKALTAAERIKEQEDFLKAAGYDAEKMFKEQRESVEKEKGALAGDKQSAMNMRLIEAGLGVLGGESPYAFVNIGKGASPALKGLQEDLKDIRKLTRDYDKALRDINTAEQTGKREMGLAALKRSQDLNDKIEERKFDLAGRMYSAEVQKQIAGMPGAEERLIDRYMRDPRFATSAKDFFASRYPNAASRVDSAVLQEYAKNPMKLEMLKSTNPELYNYIKAQLSTLGVPSVISAPAGRPVRE